MTKDFDLQSPQWLDIVFKGRNKRYGAYQLRNDSSNRHIKSLVVVFCVAILAVFLPRIIENMIPAGEIVKQDDMISQTDFIPKDEKKQDKIEQNIEIPTTPPPTLTKSVKFTEAKVVQDSKIQDENLAQANESLKNLDKEIAAKTVEDGVNDGTGINIDQFATDINTGGEEKEIDNKVYTWVQVKPSFPGGEEARLKWLEDNLVYPSQAIEANIQGLVQVGFVVEKDGSITDVKVLKPVHSLLDREAVRLVKSMPKWVPGEQNGNKVRAYYTQPIRFILRN